MNNKSENKNYIPPEVQKVFANEPVEAQKEFQRTWDLLNVAQFTPDAEQKSVSDKEEMWLQLKAQIAGDIAASTNATQNTSSNLRLVSPLKLLKSPRLLALAASLVFLVVSGYVYWQIPVKVTAPLGSMATASLPDGSVIELNSGSTISYARNFGALPFGSASSRDVVLEGEAYFKVTKSSTPFTVETFNANISVLGTEFNVRAWKEDLNQTKVTLASGKVKVASSSTPQESVILDTPSEQVIISDEGTSSIDAESIDLESTLLWRQEGIAIKDEPLRAVFSELERRFNVDIFVNDQRILEDSLNVIFSRPGSIESILDDICASNSLNYRKTSRGYEVYQ